eukprot:jgi/Bigna1/137523/aug1.39_g12231
MKTEKKKEEEEVDGEGEGGNKGRKTEASNHKRIRWQDMVTSDVARRRMCKQLQEDCFVIIELPSNKTKIFRKLEVEALKFFEEHALILKSKYVIACVNLEEDEKMRLAGSMRILQRQLFRLNNSWPCQYHKMNDRFHIRKPLNNIPKKQQQLKKEKEKKNHKHNLRRPVKKKKKKKKKKEEGGRGKEHLKDYFLGFNCYGAK